MLCFVQRTQIEFPNENNNTHTKNIFIIYNWIIAERSYKPYTLHNTHIAYHIYFFVRPLFYDINRDWHDTNIRSGERDKTITICCFIFPFADIYIYLFVHCISYEFSLANELIYPQPRAAAQYCSIWAIIIRICMNMSQTGAQAILHKWNGTKRQRKCENRCLKWNCHLIAIINTICLLIYAHWLNKHMAHSSTSYGSHTRAHIRIHFKSANKWRKKAKIMKCLWKLFVSISSFAHTLDDDDDDVCLICVLAVCTLCTCSCETESHSGLCIDAGVMCAPQKPILGHNNF